MRMKENEKKKKNEKKSSDACIIIMNRGPLAVVDPKEATLVSYGMFFFSYSFARVW